MAPLVVPILPSIELDFFAEEGINPGMVSGDATFEMAALLAQASGRDGCIPDQPIYPVECSFCSIEDTYLGLMEFLFLLYSAPSSVSIMYE